MFVIVGLGNPGTKYENTRHNMGFKTIDVLSEKFGIKVDKLKFKSLIGEGIVHGEKVILVKPQTFMNLSGEAVRDIVSFYKVPMENLLVVYDDIDLDTGTFRIRKQGSSGTHNGMRNIIYLLQDDSFPRVRIGIGSFLKNDLINYVTGDVCKEEAELLYPVIMKVADAIDQYIESGIDIAMNRFNVRKKKEDD